MEILPLASMNASSANLTLSANFTLPVIYQKVDSAFPQNSSLELSATLRSQLENTGGIEFATSNSSSLTFKCALANCTTGNSVVTQFAFVAVDESSKLNIGLFGNNSSTLTRNETTTGEFPSRLPVAAVGNHSVSTPEFQKFQNLGNSAKIGQVWNSIYDNAQNRRDKARFYSFHKGELIDFIPYGYLSDNGTVWTRYPDGGLPKFDLNRMATTNSTATDKANAIASLISRNLINFHRRDPAFANEQSSPAIPSSPKIPTEPTQLYNKRIAASIVDYIDPDSAPTGVTDDLLAGKEQTPYVMQVAERFIWQGSSSNSTTGASDVSIGHTVFIQLWNPYTATANGTLRFEIQNFRQIIDTGAAGFRTEIPLISGTLSVSLEPNQIRVFQVGSQNINAGTSSANLTFAETDGSIIPLLNIPNHTAYKVYWQGNLFDQSSSYNNTLFPVASGLKKNEMVLFSTNSTSNPRWTCNVIPSAMNNTPWPNTIYHSVGDPRQNQINNYVWPHASYIAASLRWNGSSVYTENSDFTQFFHRTWINRDSIRQNAELHVGNPPTNASTDPTSLASTYDSSLNGDRINAPFFIRNGNMTTIAELSHIYDPSHLNDSGINAATSQTSNGTSVSSRYAYGGGRTLRIGQPEFRYPTYDLAGQRAVSLLDLFTVNTTTSNKKRPSGVNINSAPQEVLTNFFYNIAQTADLGQSAPGGSPYSLSVAGAERIANKIITGRPYYNASDFGRFSDEFTTAANYSPPFPTTQPTSPAGTPATLDVMDRGREEVFRRAFNYLETKSGAFRFYGIGRVLNRNGTVASQVAIEALVELKGSVDAGGNPVLNPVVVWKKIL